MADVSNEGLLKHKIILLHDDATECQWQPCFVFS